MLGAVPHERFPPHHGNAPAPLRAAARRRARAPAPDIGSAAGGAWPRSGAQAAHRGVPLAARPRAVSASAVAAPAPEGADLRGAGGAEPAAVRGTPAAP